MADMLEGTAKLLNFFKSQEQKARRGQITVVVGYTAAYAIYVHEDLKARHSPGKTAKYLEKPFVELKEELFEQIRKALVATGDMRLSLLVAGMRLQRESQKIVPIDTGNLKASAFTREEQTPVN
jgi:hypothetical protein